jgi:hypothetical protein
MTSRTNPPRPFGSLAALAGAVLALSALPGPTARAHDGVHEEIAATSRRLDRHARDVEALLRRAELRRLAGDWSGAATDIASARRIEPARIEIDLCEAALALDRGAAARAIPAADRYLAVRPDDPRALRLRARARLALGSARAAVEDFDRAFAADRRATPDHCLERAAAQRTAGFSAEEILAGLDQGMARIGNVASLVFPAIDIEVERGRHDAALSRLDGLATGAAPREALLGRRADILAAAGRLPESRAAYAAAVAEIESLPAAHRARRATREFEARMRAALASSTPAPKMDGPGALPSTKGVAR